MTSNPSCWKSPLSLSLVAISSVSNLAGGMDFKWSPLKGAAKGKLDSIPNGFRLTMEQTPNSKGFVTAATTLSTVITPKQQIRFRWRGGANNQATTFGLIIYFRDLKTGKRQWKVHRVGSADGPFWRAVALRFDRDFRLMSGSYELTSIRFGLTGKDNPQVYSSIDIADLVIVTEADLSLLQSEFLVVPAKRRQRKRLPRTAGYRPAKVYFDFDNNDFKLLLTKRHEEPVYEQTPNAGFRDLVLANCEGIVQRVDSPDTADVIVYSRTAKGICGPAIAKAVQRGAGLVVYGNVPDSDVAALLPAEISVRQINGLPERQPAAESGLPIFGGIRFNDVDFGVYLDLGPRHGAETVLAYADGEPLAVGRGKILQYGVGIGTTLLPSDVFYDKLLLHSILWYGSSNPTESLKVLSAHEREVKSRLEAEERAFVEAVTDAAGIARQDSGRYCRGMSHANIGRFGYLIEEGLPCDNIDSSLKVVDAGRGIQGYTFDVAAKQSVVEPLPPGSRHNSNPKLVVADSIKRRELAVTDINWIYTQYAISTSSGAHRLSLSAVSPFILYEFPQSRARMILENVAEYAAYATAAGVKVVNLQNNDTLYDFQRDGDLTAPWILLYRNGKTSPLMLALSRNIASVRVERTRLDIGGLLFDGAGKPLDEIAVGRPWGITVVDTSGWQRALPKDAISQVTRALVMAFNFPVACDEIYHVDRDRREVEIVNRFRFHRVKDEWNTECSPYAVLPPVTAFAISKGIVGTCGEDLSGFSMNTKFGPLTGVRGKSTIRYSLPLPDRIDPLLPEVASTGNGPFMKAMNESAIAACRWSCRTTPAAAFNPARPLGSIDLFNIDPFAWQMGMGILLDGYFQFDDVARRVLDERIRRRVLEPMDLYRYKNFDCSRVEPFSGIEYSVNFHSVYPNPVNYAPGFGTKLVFGDGNEAYAQIAWIAVMMADRLGYARQVRNAWPHYKYLARYNKRIDDWAFHSSSCREYGIGGWSDMLNCEYPALYYHARLAEIAGDRHELDNALYRAAKKTVPTLARLRFDSYLHANQLIPANLTVAIGLGFNEYDGAKYYTAPLECNRYIRDAVDIFDFSQGFPGALSHLYRRRVPSEIGGYLTKQAIPALIDSGGKFSSIRYLTVLAQFCDQSVPLERYAGEALVRYEKSLPLDRRGYDLGCVLGNVLAWKYQVPRIQICRGVKMTKCSFDVNTRQLTLIFSGSREAEIVILRPRSIRRDGRTVDRSSWEMGEGGTSLPIGLHTDHFVAQY